MMTKVTYDLVEIPVYAYLIPGQRESKCIHPLAYKQIPTSTNYFIKSFFPRTTVQWNVPPTCTVLLPTMTQFSNDVCQVVHVSPNHQILFYLITILTLFSHCKNSSHTLLEQIKNLFKSSYYMHNKKLESVDAAKYLGVSISKDLSWYTHIINISEVQTEH